VPDVAGPPQARPPHPAGGNELASKPDKRFAATRARVATVVDEGRERVEHARARSTTVAFSFDAFAHDRETGGVVLAAALGFRAFLFQIPYFCFLAILTGYIADALNRAPKDLFHTSGIGGLIAGGITNTTKLSGGARLTALLGTGYALFLGARSLLKVMRVVHTLVWRVPLQKASKPSRATAALLGIVTASITLSVGITALRDRLFVGELVALALYSLVPFVVWLYASWWLPHRDCQIWALAPGAALFAAGVQALHVFTVVWFPHQIEGKSQTYGSFGIALAILLWSYLFGCLITFAAVLNAALWARREHDAPGSSLERPHWPLVNSRIAKRLERAFPLRPRTAGDVQPPPAVRAEGEPGEAGA
jgi:uncharacterized BrkB/YihY/UPF0761 family membrane protein